MKRALYAVAIIAIMVMTGCRKKSIIPDDTLAEIFHDAFVVNAYIGEERINLDSLQIYEPIFARYGYTANDVIHTVGNFSRRKSARLGTVVERAISRLERESKEYAKGVVVLDTIRNVAVRTMTREVYADTLIKATKMSDTTALQIEISPIYKGEYTIKYRYECKDDLEKYPRKAEFYFKNKYDMRSGFASVTLRPNGNINRTIVSKNNSGKLVLELAKFNKPPYINKKRKRLLKKQDFTIHDLKVVYKPNEEDAVDSLFARYVDVKIFADGFLIKTDSLALSPDSTRVSTPTTHND